MGHQLLLNPELSDRFVGHPTWMFSLPAHEEILTLIPSRRGPVASIGKVLGNRSTLYKYLNPHLMTLTTSSLTSHPPRCAIYVVDAAKGSIVYHATLPTSAGVCNVKATITENWLVYSYFDEDFTGVGQSKGHRIVSVEFYEGVKPDDKVKRYFYLSPEFFCQKVDSDVLSWLARICHRSLIEPRRSLPMNNHTSRLMALRPLLQLPRNSASPPKTLYVCAFVLYTVCSLIIFLNSRDHEL